MASYGKKYLSLLLTIALINASIQPLYASFPDPEDEVVKKVGVQARIDMLEEKLQQQLSNSAATLGRWTPSFIKQAVSKLGSWFEATLTSVSPSYFAKSPLETDYLHNRAVWLAHFSSAVGDIKEGGYSNNALHARLTQLQDMVFTGVLSPYVYEQGLKEIEESGLGNQTLFKSTREDFNKALKTAPGFIDQALRHEASLYIQDLVTGRGDAQEFISHIRYYRAIDNALDYKNTLTTIRSYLREHKRVLKITKKDYEAIIATLNTEIGRITKDEKKRLQANQAFCVAASSELPYYGQEWDEIIKPTNNALAEPSKEKDLIEGYLDTPTKVLRKLVHTGAKYVLEHPTQAFMIALASQVAAAAALKVLKEQEILKEPRSQRVDRARYVRNNKNEYSQPFSLIHARGDEFLINQNTTITVAQIWPCSVTSLDNGNVFVAWFSLLEGATDNYGRIFSIYGTALNDEFLINQNTT